MYTSADIQEDVNLDMYRYLDISPVLWSKIPEGKLFF